MAIELYRYHRCNDPTECDDCWYFLEARWEYFEWEAAYRARKG